MEKANNMMTDNDMMCWHALYTAPKSEHKLMQRLNAAGYTTYCPMQAVFVKWKGHTRKVITPLFSGCLFVAGNVSEVTSLASSQKAAILVDTYGIEVEYVRNGANNSRTHVCNYYFFNDNLFATIILSYRQDDIRKWETDFSNIIKTFKWNNKK